MILMTAKVSIYPTEGPGFQDGMHDLKFKINDGLTEHTLIETVREDFLVSHFDLVFDRIKDKFKRLLLEKENRS